MLKATEAMSQDSEEESIFIQTLFEELITTINHKPHSTDLYPRRTVSVSTVLNSGTHVEKSQGGCSNLLEDVKVHEY